MNMNVEKFEPGEISATKTILIIGKRGSGKTTLLSDIAFHIQQHCDREGITLCPIAVSPTDDTTRALSSFVPPSLVHETIDDRFIAAVLETQKQQWSRGHGCHTLLILDDCSFDKARFKTVAMRELFLNGRHRRCGVILTTQYCMDIPPDIRQNIDVLFVLADSNHISRNKIWKNFFGVLPTYKSFSSVLDRCTQNRECLVLKNYGDTT